MLDLSNVQKTQYEYKRERERKVNEMRRLIASWSKKELLSYIYNHNKKYPVTDAGMSAIIERFIHTDELKLDTLAEDLKMGFDIVLAICRNKKIYHQTTDLVLEFTQYYKEVIKYYDRQSAQTYYHKLAHAYEKSVNMVNKKLEIEQEMRVKY